ncbi:hypothetical protein MJ923_13735 [Shewanella sp. 3B26]|uniref:Uncharacterized protein n=1 Tax=Shewanella zhuhaiensis TaxID=2919576 RepID=A0AAJ1BK83_9GAMM|nr:hypothetical protein [Shewanella zhuhaiensis]MCH4295367.1 hypothetical protein [Shewanella zhuhaiensis]
MPLPFIVAGIAFGAVTSAILNKGGKAVADIEGGENNEKPEKPEITKLQKKEYEFIVCLTAVAAYSDGNFCDEERKEIDLEIDRLLEVYKETEDLVSIRSSLKDKKNEYIDFRKLHNRWDALEDSSKQKVKDLISPIIMSVIRADAEFTYGEKAFWFRTQLMLNGLPDQEIYKITDSHSIKNTPSIEYVHRSNKNFILENLTNDDVLICHPAHIKSDIKELISIDELFEDSFVISQDSELVNVARIAGAKKVKIYRSDSSSETRSSTVECSLGAKGNGASLDKNASDFLLESGNKTVEFTFKGGNESKFNRFVASFSSPDKELLRKSKWLQHDDMLVQFVKGCFDRGNQASTFKLDVSTDAQRNIIETAKIVANFKIFKTVSVDAVARLDKKSELFKSSRTYYEVEF